MPTYWTNTNATYTIVWHESPKPPTARERRRQEIAAAQRERERLALAEAFARQAAEREAADRRAEELLWSMLDGRQRRQYRRSKSFVVTGKDRRKYRIHRRWVGHVTRLSRNGRREVERFCIHPVDRVPLADNQLVAKLMLETDPAEFRRIANVTPLAA